MRNKLLILVLGLFLFQSCYRNPVTGKKEFLLMNESQELAMGKQADPSIVANFGKYEDENLQKFINLKGKEMASISHRSKLQYEFKVLDSPVVNAFAVPGGYVYFTRGIMAHFNNEAEFAGVLGHEIGHITAKHSAKQQTSQILSQIGLIAGVIISPDFAQYAQQAQQGLSLLLLKFGRDHESESDKLGVQYSTKIGYDAKEMANFFNTIKRIGDKSGQQIPTFLSTHPDPVDRNKQVNLMARAYQQKWKTKNLKVGRNEYLKRIDGIVYGEDPKQGFVENNMFYHPELKFKFPVPKTWKYQNSPIQFQMATKDGEAMMLLTLAAGNNMEEAVQNTIKQYNLDVYQNRAQRINGITVRNMISTVRQQNNGQPQDPKSVVRVRTTIFEYGGMFLAFHGMSYAHNFDKYSPDFERVIGGFDKLNDPDKINRLPERVRIKTVNKAGTFKQVMQSFNMPNNRMEELAILNGMKQTDKVKAGMLIKTISN